MQIADQLVLKKVAIPKQSISLSANQMKSYFGILVISLSALVAATFYWNNTSHTLRLQAEEIAALTAEVSKLRSEMELLQPLVKVMAAANVGGDFPEAYMPVQATGVPNAVTLSGDDPLAWCPANENQGIEWLRLSYAEPVIIAEINIHANFNPGAVVQVDAFLEDGSIVNLWKASDEIVTSRKQTIAVHAGVAASQIQLTLDVARVPGWNEIDAVEIVSSEGERYWATSAEASSYWTAPPK